MAGLDQPGQVRHGRLKDGEARRGSESVSALIVQDLVLSVGLPQGWNWIHHAPGRGEGLATQLLPRASGDIICA
jgi:hypothetical protein